MDVETEAQPEEDKEAPAAEPAKDSPAEDTAKDQPQEAETTATTSKASTPDKDKVDIVDKAANKAKATGKRSAPAADAQPKKAVKAK